MQIPRILVGGFCLTLSVVLIVTWQFHLADGIAMARANPALSGTSVHITVAAMLAFYAAAIAELLLLARQSFLALTREN